MSIKKELPEVLMAVVLKETLRLSARAATLSIITRLLRSAIDVVKKLLPTR